MQSTLRGASSVQELAMRLADAVQELLSDIRQNIETCGADPTVAAASLNAPLRRGSALVADLRAYGGAQRLVASDTELPPLLRSLADALQRTLDQRIRVEADLDGGCGSVFVDAAALEDALLRLATNARDAMPDGGRLRLAACNGQLTDGTPAVEISVIDSGAGMAPEVAEAALEPFSTSKRGNPMSGLGLAAVDGFARQSGGTLVLQSRPGTGTHVTLKLPVVRAPY
jgi:signal transduction histidine kinase